MDDSTSDAAGRRDAKSRARRLGLTAKIADILLAEGVAQIPLRDLAAKLGTSDRMLLYYFEDKADLVRATIEEVSSRMGVMLAAVAGGRRPPAQVLTVASRLLASPAAAPFMNVWADIAARGGRGEEPFRTIAQGSVRGSLDWLDAQLAIPDAASRHRVASAILAVVEGVRMIEIAAPGATDGVTELLSASFVQPPGAPVKSSTLRYPTPQTD